MNVCMFVGRLTADPRQETTKTGKTVCRFSLAINKSKDNVVFVDCVAWDKTAEFIAKYFTKGNGISVSSTYCTDSWLDQEGNKCWKNYFLVKEVAFTPGNTTIQKKDSHEDNMF